jgi:hypothetical protein
METVMQKIETVAELNALYGQPVEASIIKVTPFLTPEYRRMIEASPFVALATVGPEGLDCSPRGDAGHVLYVEDERTILQFWRRRTRFLKPRSNCIGVHAGRQIYNRCSKTQVAKILRFLRGVDVNAVRLAKQAVLKPSSCDTGCDDDDVPRRRPNGRSDARGAGAHGW